MREWERQNNHAIAAQFAPKGCVSPNYSCSVLECLIAIAAWKSQDADNRWWILESSRPGHPGGGYLCELRFGSGGIDVFGEGDTLAEAMAWALWEAVRP